MGITKAVYHIAASIKKIYFNTISKNKKPNFFQVGFFYIDGLVSTGIVNPYTILKLFFTL